MNEDNMMISWGGACKHNRANRLIKEAIIVSGICLKEKKSGLLKKSNNKNRTLQITLE